MEYCMKNIFKIVSVILLLAMMLSFVSVISFADEAGNEDANTDSENNKDEAVEGDGDAADNESADNEETGNDAGSGDTTDEDITEDNVDKDVPDYSAYELVDTKAHVDQLNSMGYDLPYEGDLSTPKYKIIYSDGREVIKYDALGIYLDTYNLREDATIELLSSLYLSEKFYQSIRANAIFYRVLAVSLQARVNLNFDFAGHTIFTEHKVAFFSVSSGATLSVYSSKPGAQLINVEEGKTTGGNVITVNGGSCAYFGDHEDYPGSNLKTYTAGGFSTNGNGQLYVSGIDCYRAATDYVGYFTMSGHGGILSFDGVRAFGVSRYLQIAFREDGDGDTVTHNNGSCYGNNMYFKDCVLSNIGSQGVVTGSFFRYMADDNSIAFEGCIFDNVSFGCEKYYEHENTVDIDGNRLRECKTAVISLDKYCSYNMLPDVKSITDKAYTESSDGKITVISKFAMYQFPELAPGYGLNNSGVPKYILANGLVNGVECFLLNDFSANPTGYNDFTMIASDEDISGMYCLPYKGYEEEIREVIWSFKGTSYNEQEYWIKGYTPVPYRLNVPKDTEYIQYVIEEIYSDDEVAYYSINPKVNLTFKLNYTFSDKIYTNIYIPVYEDFPINQMVYRMSVAGTTVKQADILLAETVEIDGRQYYKVVVPVTYEMMTESMYVSVDVPNSGGTGVGFTISKKVDFLGLMKSYLDGDYDEKLKADISEVLYIIYKKASNAAVIPGIVELVEDIFAERIEAEKNPPAAEKPTKEPSIIDKILGKLGLAK